MLGEGKTSDKDREPSCVQFNRALSPSLVCRKGGGTGIEHSPLFAGISPSDYAGMASAARGRDFARGEMLHIEGDRVQQVVLLTQGLVKINKLGACGAEVILRLVVPGDVIGAVDLFAAGRHSATAQAFRRCRALVWDARVFGALMQRLPVLQQNMVRILGEHLLELGERFHELATERVGPRVARQLVRLLEQIGQPVNGEVELSLSREELAQMTGTTLFTVSRLLCGWEARGMVRPRRESVTICDVALLRAISEQSAPAAGSSDAGTAASHTKCAAGY